jgi:peroxiredoxin
MGAGFLGPETTEAQEPSAFLAVGEMAPDIELTGATRHGVLSEAVSLGDLRGETVVLAFFFKVRTGG